MLAEHPTVDSAELARQRAALPEAGTAAEVGDEAPPAPPGPTPAAREYWRRQRRVAAFGLVVVIVLLAAAVTYLATHDSGTTTAATAPSTVATTATTVTPTFLPGAKGGEPTTAVPTTVAAPATTAAAPATTVTTAVAATPATVDPRSRIAFAISRADCTPGGQLSVFGTVTNNNPSAYSFSFVVTVLRPDGSSQGSGSGAVAHMPPGGRYDNGGQPIATGLNCSYPLVAGPQPRGQVTSIAQG
jgi:hypothetical protein